MSSATSTHRSPRVLQRSRSSPIERVMVVVASRVNAGARMLCALVQLGSWW